MITNIMNLFSKYISKNTKHIINLSFDNFPAYESNKKVDANCNINIKDDKGKSITKVKLELTFRECLFPRVISATLCKKYYEIYEAIGYVYNEKYTNIDGINELMDDIIDLHNKEHELYTKHIIKLSFDNDYNINIKDDKEKIIAKVKSGLTPEEWLFPMNKCAVLSKKIYEIHKAIRHAYNEEYIDIENEAKCWELKTNDYWNRHPEFHKKLTKAEITQILKETEDEFYILE